MHSPHTTRLAALRAPTRFCLLLSILLLIALPSAAVAQQLRVVFSDPVGDSLGPVDVVGMLLVFDGTTGDYSINLLADEAGPFAGDFRVNVNLYNPDTGTTACNPSLFNDNMNDFTSHPSSIVLTLTGTSPFLTAWQEGDRVATNSVPFGNPDCTSLFRSAVADLADPFARDFIADGPVYGTIEGVEIFADGFESGNVSAWSSSTLCPGCPIADFSFFTNGMTVTFLNSSTGDPPLSYFWDFGDGATSTEADPQHTYSTSGTYQVTLTVMNSRGVDWIAKPVTVEY